MATLAFDTISSKLQRDYREITSIHKPFLHLLFYEKGAETSRTKFVRYFYHNKFYGEEVREQFLSLFCNCQRVYNAFSRLACIYKVRKMDRFESDCDLYMNPLENYSSNIRMNLICNSRIYEFRISDLLTIIQTSLVNDEDFFSVPLYPRNPYTNIQFSKANLYNIYLRVRESSFVIPHLFHKFFLEEFDLQSFLLNNEYQLREDSITNYLHNTCVGTKAKRIRTMLSKYNSRHYPFRIDYEFPKQTLCRIFEPHLHLYLSVEYSMSPAKKHFSDMLLRKYLQTLYMYNNLLGKKYIKNKVVSFDDAYIENYSNISKDKFHNIAMEVTQQDSDSSFQNTHIRYESTDEDSSETSEVLHHNMNPENTQMDYFNFLFDTTPSQNTVHLSDDEMHRYIMENALQNANANHGRHNSSIGLSENLSTNDMSNVNDISIQGHSIPSAIPSSIPSPISIAMTLDEIVDDPSYNSM